jgi:nucleotide-binding universal stress UspA family protein
VVAVSNVVVGIDGSMTSWRAFAMAVGIARRDQGCVHACFVSHTPAPAELAVFAVPVPSFVDDDGAADLALEVSEELGRAGVGGDFALRKGDVARELEAVAATHHADLIVVGRSRHPTLHLGGVPRKLLAMGRRPILIVP